MTHDEVTFTSGGVSCAAWHIPATDDVLAKRAGRPCVVMAHGFGGTRDSGLLAYAEPFAQAGIDAFVFDYRGFGDSDGTPRQRVSCGDQRRDYHAALAAARRLPGVDPDRVALWGTSYSAGHAIAVAAQARDVAAVVALTPAVDGLATLRLMARQESVGHLVRLGAEGLADAVAAAANRRPRTVPIVGKPGSTAMITASGAEKDFSSVAGPTFRNETSARHALVVGANRPTIYARRVRCPVLVQIGLADRIAPPDAARRMTKRLGGPTVLRGYPVDHLDVYAGVWQQSIMADQLEFLSRTLR